MMSLEAFSTPADKKHKSTGQLKVRPSVGAEWDALEQEYIFAAHTREPSMNFVQAFHISDG